MRGERTIADTDQLAWQAISEFLDLKVLNGDREQGAHTILLRSRPREPGPRRGQYHETYEEFFCLSGDFTFDGSRWFGPGSYVFYPPGTVHGASVHVRGGYEVYLRASGKVETFWEDNPASLQPYPISSPGPVDPLVEVEDIGDGAWRAASGGRGNDRQIALRGNSYSEASTLISFISEDVCKTYLFGADRLLELFVLSGSFATECGELIGPRGYVSRVAPAMKLVLTVREPGEILVSFEGARPGGLLKQLGG